MSDYQSIMPVYESKLSDAGIIAALSWIKSRGPPKFVPSTTRSTRAPIKAETQLS